MSIPKSVRNRVAIIASIMLVLSMMLVLPTVSAQDINIKSLDDQSKELPAEETIEFRWVVYNNDTNTLVVQVSTLHDWVEGVSVDFEPDYAVLEPGESATIVATFTAVRAVSNMQLEYVVNFTTTSMGNVSDVSYHTETVDIDVLSLYAVNAGANRIFGTWDNTLPAPLDGNLGAFLATSLIWVLIGLVFYFVVDPTIHFLTRKTKTDLDDIILRILRKPVLLIIILYGVVNSVEILKLTANQVNEIETYYSIALILIGAYLSYKIYVEVLLFYAKRLAARTESEVDDVVVPVLEKIGMVLIPFLAIMLIFEVFGYDVTVLLAGAGFLGIVVGYAAQSTLANLFAGMQLLVSRPFKVGDKLLMDNGDFMQVQHIGLRATELLDTTNNQLIIMPNDLMANNRIINVERPDKDLTITISVGVAYGSDIELVKRLMVESVSQMPYSKKDKLPVIRLSDFADSAINMKIFIEITDAAFKWKSASDFRELLYAKFNKYGVEIPFPQQVVTLKNAPSK